MKTFKILTVGLFLFSCAVKPVQTTYARQEFNLIDVDKAFLLTVDKFIKNDAYCFTEGIPYALVIGRPISSDLPAKMSILLKCDNNQYQAGQQLNIQPIGDPTKETTLKPIYIVGDTLINGQKTRFIVGTENPGVWGQVIKDN
jgi:hypothetical protein